MMMARVVLLARSTAVTWAAFTTHSTVLHRHFVTFRGTTGSIRLCETTTRAAAHSIMSSSTTTTDGTVHEDEEGSEDDDVVTSACQPPQSLSGRCLCGGISWTLSSKNAKVGQILVCHCSMCRRGSGSTSVPYVALSRAPLWDQFSEAQRYVSSGVATRGFCPTCASHLYMDYGEEHTLWIPMGTLDPFVFDPTTWMIQPQQRDSQIFLESKAEYTDALAHLPHLPSFGTYRPDPCHPTTPFESLTPWDQVDSIANHVKEQLKTNNSTDSET